MPGCRQDPGLTSLGEVACCPKLSRITSHGHQDHKQVHFWARRAGAAHAGIDAVANRGEGDARAQGAERRARHRVLAGRCHERRVKTSPSRSTQDVSECARAAPRRGAVARQPRGVAGDARRLLRCSRRPSSREGIKTSRLRPDHMAIRREFRASGTTCGRRICATSSLRDDRRLRRARWRW